MARMHKVYNQGVDMYDKKVTLKYSNASKFFHWFIAVIVIMMLSGSFFLNDLPERYISTAYMFHKSFGLTVLFLMIVRFLWIKYKGRPELPVTMSQWEKILSKIVQSMFYILLICMPLCGWVLSVAESRVPSYFGLFNMPLPIAANKSLAKLMEQSHKTIAWILIVLLILHVAGALKHHFIDKDTVLKRMLT